MASVVIIHAAEDALPARALAEKLRGVKLSPVIETPPGDALRAAVREAPVTLALWSPRSVGQDPLIEEVNFARGKSKVVHARMQNAPTPEQFKNERAIDLTGWRGEEDFAAWRELANVVTQMAGVPAPPPPAPRPPSGFFQPGAVRPQAHAATPPPQGAASRPQPRPAAQQQPRPAAAPRAQAPPRPTPVPAHDSDAPAKKGGGAMVMIVIAIVVLAALGGGAFFFINQQGGQAASSAWENVPRNDAAALRAFIDGEPGSYRDEAMAALSALEEQSFDAAREEDSIQGYEEFLNDFPNSDHATQARGRIAELQLAPQEEAIDPNAPIDPLTGEPLAVGETAPATDPDLLPPDASQPAPDADTSGGPAALTPPPTESAAPSEPEQPTN